MRLRTNRYASVLHIASHLLYSMCEWIFFSFLASLVEGEGQFREIPWVKEGPGSEDYIQQRACWAFRHLPLHRLKNLYASCNTFTCSSENRLLLKYFSLNCNKSLDLVSKEEKLEQTNKSLFEM